jgi:hypothetical protein
MSTPRIFDSQALLYLWVGCVFWCFDTCGALVQFAVERFCKEEIEREWGWVSILIGMTYPESSACFECPVDVQERPILTNIDDLRVSLLQKEVGGLVL